MTWPEVVHQGRDKGYRGGTMPGFQPCALCGCLVLWSKNPGTKTWEWCSPCLGVMHLCGENCLCAHKEEGDEPLD